MIRRLLASWLALTAVACATEQKSSTGLELMSAAEYERVIERNTRHTQKYSGLYNVMDVTATLVNSEVARAQLDQSARQSQWDAARFQLEKNKSDDTLKQKTQVFLSFYTPERKNDDLHKTATTWKVYLQSPERRWEGTATKLKDSLAELQGLYGYHNRFATAYMLSFPVAIKDIEGQPLTLKITGPVGSGDLSF